jgi:hypothetical protein
MYVIDASIGFKWEVVGLYSDKAQQLRDDFHKAIHKMLAPDLFPMQVANALLVAAQRGRILPSKGPFFPTGCGWSNPVLFVFAGAASDKFCPSHKRDGEFA